MAAVSGVSLDKITRYGLIAVLGYTAYRMAAQGSLGAAAQKAAQEIAGAWSDSASPGLPGLPAAPGPGQPAAPAGSFAISLRDLGGQPLVYDTGRQTLRQAVAGGNVYSVGDVFKESSNGNIFQYVGGGDMVDMASGQRVAVGAFRLAV